MRRARAALRPRQRIVLAKKEYPFAADRTALSTPVGTIFALFDQDWRSASIGVRTSVTLLHQRLAAGMGEEA
jgi:hypothetical protein